MVVMSAPKHPIAPFGDSLAVLLSSHRGRGVVGKYFAAAVS